MTNPSNDPTPTDEEHRYAQVTCAVGHEKPVSDPSLVDPCHQHLWEARKVLSHRKAHPEGLEERLRHDPLDNDAPYVRCPGCGFLHNPYYLCDKFREALLSALAALREQNQELREAADHDNCVVIESHLRADLETLREQLRESERQRVADIADFNELKQAARRFLRSVYRTNTASAIEEANEQYNAAEALRALLDEAPRKDQG